MAKSKRVPKWITNPKHREYWKKPWLHEAGQSRSFKRLLWKHGRVSPNFTRAEWNCHDGTKVPWRLKGRAQRHGFHLEKFRHALGDVSLPILSGYRDPQYNAQIGGASQSRHMSGDATDFSKSVVDEVGHARFFHVADVMFPTGGVGEYPGGSAHLDSRGYRARWTSF